VKGSDADIRVRIVISIILGVLGVAVLIDVLLIGLVQPDVNYDGFRVVLFVIVGALLVIGGAITFAWPSKGSVETIDTKQSVDHSGPDEVEST
jgi:hypothetical protein